MKYRAEIDGLRAIAVLPVIFFHAGFTAFSGGFVGVDIFFVISGYLITSILINDLKKGQFSIGKFYERRARRILPALFFVILFCLPFAWLWMNPIQLKNFSQSLVAVSAFVSNILFFAESGYFQEASELKPLLHTWSLSVEEQFYIFFPLLLLILWRFGPRFVFGVIIALSTISLALSHWGSISNPNATFFLIHTRAWELGVGSLCGFILSGRGAYNSSILSATGLALIVGSITLYDTATPFPSLYALAPVGGAALFILFAQSSTPAAKLISMKPLVLIGLVSYSAYLWHQPLFAFARLQNLSAPSPLMIYALILLSFVLAAFSWRYVERPFRRRDNRFPATRSQVFGLSLFAMLIFTSIGLFGHFTKGAPFRQTPAGVTWKELGLKERLKINSGLSSECDDSPDVRKTALNSKCRTGEKPRVLLWGDSYAMHLTGALQASSFSDKNEFVQITKSQCAPILNRGVNASVTPAQGCIAFNDQVAEYLKEEKDIETVIMSSMYGMLGKQPTFNRAGNRIDIYSTEYDYEKIVETAEFIISLGKLPIFITPPPNSGADLGQCLGYALARKRPLNICDYSREEISEDRQDTFEVLDKLKDHYTVIDMRESLCTAEKCLASFDDTFLYRDTGHLSIEGSSLIGRKMDPFKRVE